MSSETVRGELQLECIADYACEIGENPLWHPVEKRLYWCDIPRGRIFRFDPSTGNHEQCYEGRPVGGFTFQTDGSLLLFMDRGTVAIWRDGKLTEILSEIEEERNSRFNDVIADPIGRVFCGTMSSSAGKGRLYRMDLDGTIRVILEGIGCSNGMAFTHDQKGFYYTDSFAHEIYLFDYRAEDGRISNQRVFASLDESDGLPDGATLDAAGHLWSAMWDGSGIVQLTLDGRIEKRISLPTRKVSSLTLGGEDYADMYITTAGGNTKDDDGPLAGATFRLKTEARGRPEFFSRIQIDR
jgi:sugar lactone lactonase YvrE